MLRPAVVFVRDGSARARRAPRDPTTRASGQVWDDGAGSRRRRADLGSRSRVDHEKPDFGRSARMVAMARNDDGLVRVGILGCGNVGARGRVACSRRNADLITRRSGVRIEVAQGRGAEPHQGAAGRARAPACSPTTPKSVVADPDVDVIVEVIGGVEPARSLDPHRAEVGQAGRDRATRSCWRTSARSCSRSAATAGRRPAVRGVGRGRHPADPAVARVAGGRAHPRA